MADPKQWALTYLGQGTSLELQIDSATAPTVTTRYDIAQFTTTWAVNEIPTAQCMLAIGRDVRTQLRAEIHATAASLRQMRRARVVFRPTGEYRPNGRRWPNEFVVFDGYFMGMAYNKIMGKAQVIANLKHWLIDLACSSCFTQNSHPLNSSHLTARAVMVASADAGARDVRYISALTGVDIIRADVLTDVWGAIKKLFCGMASMLVAIGATEQEGGCGSGDAVINTRALRALERLEGPSGLAGEAFGLPYTYGVPLALDLLNITGAEDAVAMSLCQATMEAFYGHTFWDKLITAYCAENSMAVVPAVDYALVIADTPAFRNGPWKVIDTGEYDSFQEQADLERPLRAVGVWVDIPNIFGAAEGVGGAPPANPVVSGCAAFNIADNNDGTVMYVRGPGWLNAMAQAAAYVGGTTGITDNLPSRTATTPASAGAPARNLTSSLGDDVKDLADRWAQSVFVSNMLRGRTGVVGGKLRFDIAPGSVITVKGSEERFLRGEDELATNMVGCVARVTVAINAEAGVAGTTFVLSHLRTEAENGDDRTGVDMHPLFRNAIHGGGKHGAPLVAGHELL